jgi:hypothetical protein
MVDNIPHGLKHLSGGSVVGKDSKKEKRKMKHHGG